MADMNYGGYPITPAAGFEVLQGKIFAGGVTHTVAASSTEEKCFMLMNPASSGVQGRVKALRAAVLNLPAAATATSAIIKLYRVALTGLATSGTQAYGVNMLLGGASSTMSHYNASGTATATATVSLPFVLECSVVGGAVQVLSLGNDPIVIPEGYALQASVTGGAGLATQVAITAVWAEDVA